MSLQNHLAPVPASGEEPIEILRERYGHFLAEKWYGHVLERARYRQIAERMGKGDTPDEPSGEDLATATAIIPATRDNIAKYHGWATLAQLTTAHMPDPLAKSYTAMVERVREWRNAQKHPVTTAPAMILASPCVGIGKTHVALAVAASYNGIWGEAHAAFVNGKPNFRVSKNARFMTAAELMRHMDGDEYDLDRLIPRHVECLVIDDVGREGEIKFTARSSDAQAGERHHRYFGLINYLYTRKNVALFMTTNLTVAQLAVHFNEATMSRLYEMTESRYLIDIVTKYPDVRRIKSANGGKL